MASAEARAAMVPVRATSSSLPELRKASAPAISSGMYSRPRMTETRSVKFLRTGEPQFMHVNESVTARFAACAVQAHVQRQKNACERKYGLMAISTTTKNAVKPASTKRNSFNSQKESTMGARVLNFDTCLWNYRQGVLVSSL